MKDDFVALTKCYTILVHKIKNYTILPKHNNVILLSLTWIINHANRISGRTHHICERRKYYYNILREYCIIFWDKDRARKYLGS